MGEQQKSLEKFIKKNVDFSNILKKMDKLMDNANLWHLRNQIFEDLSHEDVLNCRRVCKYWNESLRRLSDVKFIQEFGERVVEDTNKKLSTIIPEWKNAAQKYGVQASMDDIEKVKDSLKKLARGKGKCRSDPVHEAARNGDVKLMEFIFKTSFDMNSKDEDGFTAWHWACIYGQTETAQLIIKNSKEFGIDLNAKANGGSTAFQMACINGQIETAKLIIKNLKIIDIDLNVKDNKGRTALHRSCFNGQTDTVQMILKNWKEFGIDIKVQNNNGETALDIIDEEDGEEYDQIKKMLEKEYSKIDVTGSVQILNVE